MAVHRRLADVLLGSIVAVATVPTGFGPALGGWLAGRRTTSPSSGAVAGGLAGYLGALPWVALVYLAAAGAIEPIGYHRGFVHVGVNTAAPGTFAIWQAAGLALLVGSILVSVAVAGGVVAGLSEDVVWELREEFAGVRESFSNGA